ncbi:MAG: PDZ domain-containing protein, partial [candidate division NC10 bacterium]|nr:PDZ domain-containing protein [candidate division NC10 bacterium]
LVDGDSQVTFVRAGPSSPPRTRGSGAGYGPYFGMIPEFGGSDEGVRLGGVRTGSPAEKAGLRSGDLILRFDGKVVKNLEDFVFVLRGKRAGDRVEVIYRRGTEVRMTSAVLEARQ